MTNFSALPYDYYYREFKLLAIKPLKGCDPQLLKVLTVDEYYVFYKNYKIVQNGKGMEEILIDKNHPPEIFNISPNLKIQISAIVGKNGSGKSSLIELLYAALYNISHKLNMLPKIDEDEDVDEQLPYLYQANVNIAFYYQMDGRYFKIHLQGDNIYLSQFTHSLKGFYHVERLTHQSHLHRLFYSIVINYSQYALNTRDLGHWIKAIFHKNDAYQTPIVLNPYRKEGNIDINAENYLVRSRLLTNILESNEVGMWFNGKEKIPKRLIFNLDESKFEAQSGPKKEILDNYHEISRRILLKIFKIFFPKRQFSVGFELLDEYAKKYIILKLESISHKYRPYWKFQNFHAIENKKILSSYLLKLKGDHSHVTFKLRQAIHFLLFNTLPKHQKRFDRSIKFVSEKIADIQNKEPHIPTIELIPPSFLTTDIQFHNSHDRFERFSSGEKQKVYAMSSLIYHLKNLNSVSTSERQNHGERSLVKYSHINIIFDEVELYYHPDLQRRFIKDLLDNIRATKLETIRAINFLFVTHSPFILSDIPDANIMYLGVQKYKTVQLGTGKETFGGNIHDLLANSFFLSEDGYMGEYAKDVIHSAIQFLKPVEIVEVNQKISRINSTTTLPINWDRYTVRALIDMIGEPVLKRSLNRLYSDKFLTKETELDEEIARLQKLKIQQKQRKNDPSGNLPS